MTAAMANDSWALAVDEQEASKSVSKKVCLLFFTLCVSMLVDAASQSTQTYPNLDTFRHFMHNREIVFVIIFFWMYIMAFCVLTGFMYNMPVNIVLWMQIGKLQLIEAGDAPKSLLNGSCISFLNTLFYILLQFVVLLKKILYW